MVQRANQEPTMDEIVVALRETHRGAGHAAPFQVIGRRSGNGSRAPNVVSYPRNWTAGATAVTDLRDSETERLLAENAQLNERVVFLLKIIERSQAHSADRAALEAERAAMLRDVKGALKAELRPALLMLLRGLEKQHTDTPAADTATDDMPSAWIVDLINKLEANDRSDWLGEPLLLSQSGPTLRQRLSRFFHELGF
jgi:hypothetical protein